VPRASIRLQEQMVEPHERVMFTCIRSVGRPNRSGKRTVHAKPGRCSPRMEIGVFAQRRRSDPCGAEARIARKHLLVRIALGRGVPATWRSLASFRATSTRLKPPAANSFASSWPMPEDAPVINAQSPISAEAIPSGGGAATTAGWRGAIGCEVRSAVYAKPSAVP